MDIEAIRAYCLSKPAVEECLPFNETTLVYKVGGKMFLLAATDEVPPSINVKSDPATALDLRDRYAAVTPGYHMNKKYWNTVMLDGTVPARLINEWIDASYALVLAGLPKSIRTSAGT